MKKEERKKLADIRRQLMQQAFWIGEYGDACCVSSTAGGALIKFRRLMREDVGDFEAEEMSIENISTGWVRLAHERDADEVGCECGCHTSNSSDEEMKKYGCDICKDSHEPSDEYDWYVTTEKETPLTVFVYNA